MDNCEEHCTMFDENGLHLAFGHLDDGALALLHFGPAPFVPATIGDDQSRKRRFRIVQAHCSGENQCDHHGEKHTRGSLSSRLIFDRIDDERNSYGRKLAIVQHDAEQAQVISHVQFYDGLPAVRSWTEVVNTGDEPLGLEYVSSFALTGLAKEGMHEWDEKSRVHIGHNTWCGEAQWKAYPITDLGLDRLGGSTMKRVHLSTTGTWPTSSYLSMGAFENTETSDVLIWEIEHNGSWSWEISTLAGTLYLLLSGPCETEHHWWKALAPGERFTSVPVSVACVNGSFDQAVAALTDYRRRTRRPNADNAACPVIFNDYMNCLSGNPATATLMPLIDAAAEAGCEYFVIDAGWYDDGWWWDTVGEWLPAKTRFPNGITEPLDRIRQRGMVPGLWLELEVMGVKCPLVAQWPDECFFVRHGRPVIDNGRYQLDFRHPRVLQHADEVLARLVEEYGVGYVKMDYNINAGPGTEVAADSFGDGLLQHNRAYLAWLDRVFVRYPDLVIENCGSGGLRMNHALLSRCSIQSSSDQGDRRKYASIAAGCLAAVTPEQCAVWSYPQRNGDEEETIFNMVNCLLMRIHQSGHLSELSPERLALVREGIACYKTYREKLPRAHPFWPLGLPSLRDGWVTCGLELGDEALLAVWRVHDDADTLEIPLARCPLRVHQAELLYPKQYPVGFSLSPDGRALVVQLPQPCTARLFRLTGKT